MEWITQYSHNVTLKKPIFGECKFNFPTSDGIHLLVKPVNSLGNKKLITAKFTISPTTAKFKAAGGGTPKIHMYFQRRYDDMSASGPFGMYRQYSNPTNIVLTAGVYSVSVPLLPGQWQGVNGKLSYMDPMGFREAVNNAEYVGLVFGDDSGFAHGAWATTVGAKFKLQSFEITG